MYKWLFIFLLIPACVLAESQAESGTFTLSGTAQAKDCYLGEAAQATNYGADTFIYISESPGSSGTGERRGLIKFPVLPDSMAGRLPDSGKLGFVILTEAITSAFLVVRPILAAKPWLEVDAGAVKGACWDFAKYTEATDTIFWDAEGCMSSGVDFDGSARDSTNVSSAVAGDTVWVDVSVDLAAGLYSNGWVLYLTQAALENTKYYSANAVGKQSFLKVWWTESTVIEPICNDGQFNVPTGIGIYDVTAARMKTFDATLDSMSVRMLGVDNDTLFGLCYKNFDADSGLLEVGETLVVTTGASCEDVMLQFSGTTLLKADSSYFFGVQHKPISQDAYSFCITDRATDTSYYGTAYPNPITGSKTTNGSTAICFTAYLTEYSAPTDNGARVIIISSCESDETPYFNGQSWSNIE